MDTRKNGYGALIVLQSVLYGIMDPVAKLAYAFIPVYCFLTLRYALSTGIMLLLWRGQIVRELKTVPVKAYLLPGVCMATAFIFSNLALRYTAATNVAFLRSLSALFVPLLAVIFLGAKCKARELPLFLAMLLGLYLLCARGGLGRFGTGELLSIVAALLVAGSLTFGQETLHRISAKTLSFVQSALAFAVCGTLSVATGAWGQGSTYNLQIVSSLLYAAIGCTIGGYMLQNVALEHVPAKTIGVLQTLYPVTAAVVAFLVLGERLSWHGFLGAAIIVGCIVWKNLHKEE